MTYYAEAFNQYGRAIGEGFGSTEEEAVGNARQKAKDTLAQANANWKWRIAKIKIQSKP